MTGRNHRTTVRADSAAPAWWNDNHERIIDFAFRLAAGCVPAEEAEGLAFRTVMDCQRSWRSDTVDVPSVCRTIAGRLDTLLAGRVTEDVWQTALTRAAYLDALHDLSPVQQQVLDLLLVRQLPCRDVAAATGLSAELISRQALHLCDAIANRSPDPGQAAPKRHEDA
jgi:hypothetical protein